MPRTSTWPRWAVCASAIEQENNTSREEARANLGKDHFMPIAMQEGGQAASGDARAWQVDD
jgi:hypothetical protein